MVEYIKEQGNFPQAAVDIWFNQLYLCYVDTKQGKAYFYTTSENVKNTIIGKFSDYINNALYELLLSHIKAEILVFTEEEKEEYEKALRESEDSDESFIKEIIERKCDKIEDEENEEEDIEKRIEELINTYNSYSDDPKKKNVIDGYTFDNFVVGSSNTFAKSVCYAVAKEPNTYNPLFIYGNSGLGKTHLLYAIINYIKQNIPHAKIIYKKCESFLDELIKALNDGDTASFKERYRTCDVLLIDDIQFLAGKEQTQEEFFHTFSALYEADKQIILASDRPPRDIKPLEDRLRSRFEGGLLADLQPPNYELRVAIIKKKADSMGVNLSPEIIDYIAQRIRDNIRQIEGVVKKLYALQSLTSAPITKENAENVISIIDPDNVPVETMIEKILSQVSNNYGVSVGDMKSKRKTEEIANARHVAVYVIKTLTPLTLKEIGAIFDRDYSTIISSINKVDVNKKTINGYEDEINKIIKAIKK